MVHSPLQERSKGILGRRNAPQQQWHVRPNHNAGARAAGFAKFDVLHKHDVHLRGNTENLFHDVILFFFLQTPDPKKVSPGELQVNECKRIYNITDGT
jgi:hypothetical protein